MNMDAHVTAWHDRLDVFRPGRQVQRVVGFATITEHPKAKLTVGRAEALPLEATVTNVSGGGEMPVMIEFSARKRTMMYREGEHFLLSPEQAARYYHPAPAKVEAAVG